MPSDTAVRFGTNLPDLARFFLYREDLTAVWDVVRRSLPVIDRRPPRMTPAPEADALLARMLKAHARGHLDQRLGSAPWQVQGEFYFAQAQQDGGNRALAEQARNAFLQAKAIELSFTDGGKSDRLRRIEARLGDLYRYVLDEPEKAVEHYRCATEEPLNDETDAPILLSLGEVLADLGRLDEARDAFEHVLKPTVDGRLFIRAMSRLGGLEYSLGRLEHAREYLMNAIRLSETLPETAAVREDLLEYYLALGEIPSDRDAFAKAREIAEDLLREHPDSPEYRRNLDLAMRHYERHADGDG